MPVLAAAGALVVSGQAAVARVRWIGSIHSRRPLPVVAGRHRGPALLGNLRHAGEVEVGQHGLLLRQLQVLLHLRGQALHLQDERPVGLLHRPADLFPASSLDLRDQLPGPGRPERHPPRPRLARRAGHAGHGDAGGADRARSGGRVRGPRRGRLLVLWNNARVRLFNDVAAAHLATPLVLKLVQELLQSKLQGLLNELLRLHLRVHLRYLPLHAPHLDRSVGEGHLLYALAELLHVNLPTAVNVQMVEDLPWVVQLRQVAEHLPVVVVDARDFLARDFPRAVLIQAQEDPLELLHHNPLLLLLQRSYRVFVLHCLLQGTVHNHRGDQIHQHHAEHKEHKAKQEGERPVCLNHWLVNVNDIVKRYELHHCQHGNWQGWEEDLHVLPELGREVLTVLCRQGDQLHAQAAKDVDHDHEQDASVDHRAPRVQQASDQHQQVPEAGDQPDAAGHAEEPAHADDHHRTEVDVVRLHDRDQQVVREDAQKNKEEVKPVPRPLPAGPEAEGQDPRECLQRVDREEPVLEHLQDDGPVLVEQPLLLIQAYGDGVYEDDEAHEEVKGRAVKHCARYLPPAFALPPKRSRAKGYTAGEVGCHGHQICPDVFRTPCFVVARDRAFGRPARRLVPFPK
mmetsp:Transcript_13839/g.39632  ORF Transcript_13839/g.39632 Transcript_13839/m.39632 type:complete len:626 (-) Transcript_13839:150-2027(-)